MQRPACLISIRQSIRLLTVFSVLVFLCADRAHSDDRYIHLKFYSADLTFPTVAGIDYKCPATMDRSVFTIAYRKFENSSYHPFLKKVGDYRRGMNLSDWHFYEIVADCSEMMFKERSSNFRILFQWFILRKSGLDVRLFHTEKEVYLHAPSEEIEFGFYTIEKSGRRFVNLTARRDNLRLDNVEATMPNLRLDGAIMPLHMGMDKLPNLPAPATIERLIEFNHRGATYQVKVNLNRDHLDIMDDYPYYNQAHYFKIGLSYEAETSLLPELERLMKRKTLIEKIEFILSFTRTSFFYKDDRRRYGKEKPMTPEQTLYHSYSDCEDRSALFFYLCRKLLDLPVIVLDFQTHVGVAVELPQARGKWFEYKGRKFVYCEPTGPQDKLRVGEMWEKVSRQKARVITEYIPQ